MLAKAFLEAADSLPSAALRDLLGDGGAIIVAPHPDDESLGCGALIAAARSEGRSVCLVVVSDGSGSHPASRAYPPERLRAVREEELREAAEVLGVEPGNILFLRLPDRFVPGSGPQAYRAAAAIAAQAREIGAGALFVTWRHDPHCDHRAAYAIARLAQRDMQSLRLFEYPVWGHLLPAEANVREALRGWRFDGRAERARKQRAIACHRSQTTDLIGDDPTGFRLDASTLRLFDRDIEIFLELET